VLFRSTLRPEMGSAFRQTSRGAAPAPTWGAVLVAVLFGTVVAAVLLLPVLYVLMVLHLLPGDGITSDISPGPGWPWPIRDPWTALADMGPMVGAAAAMAMLVRRELRRLAGGELRLWPVVGAAVVVGWLPVARPQGLLELPFPIAFMAIVVVVRLSWERTPLVPPALATSSRRVRRPPPRPPWAVAAAVAGCIALAAASLGYHALHPLRIDSERAGTSLRIVNDGPASVRLLSVHPPDARGRQLVRFELPTSSATLAASMAGLLSPGSRAAIGPGGAQRATAALAVPRCAARFAVTLNAVAVRLRVRWVTTTQRVRLRRPLRVTCRANA
jgi:hypothetical protein